MFIKYMLDTLEALRIVMVLVGIPYVLLLFFSIITRWDIVFYILGFVEPASWIALILYWIYFGWIYVYIFIYLSMNPMVRKEDIVEDLLTIMNTWRSSTIISSNWRLRPLFVITLIFLIYISYQWGITQ